jgi:hypothetical protein
MASGVLEVLVLHNASLGTILLLAIREQAYQVAGEVQFFRKPRIA